MKKISIKESELRSVIQEILGSSFDLTPQETKLKKVFGRYEPEVSDDVIRYMRKNPAQFFKRLYQMYGDKAYEYLDNAKNKGGI